jgi:hypothetical protein
MFPNHARFDLRLQIGDCTHIRRSKSLPGLKEGPQYRSPAAQIKF